MNKASKETMLSALTPKEEAFCVAVLAGQNPSSLQKCL